MLATFCLFSCALVTAQPAGGPERLLVPRLERGQELVYTGSFTEEVTGEGVQLTRSYWLENRVCVLDATPRGVNVAIQTIHKLRAARPGPGRPGETSATPPVTQEPSSVRLELATIDLQGRLTPAPGDGPLLVPLEGPATVECGAFVETPRNRLGANEIWAVTEDGRPPRTWRLLGSELVAGTSCYKLVGLQQSEDWDRPRADRTAWRRQDTVWIAPRLGVAARVERTIERREPARTEPTHRSVLTYQLDSSLVYPLPLLEDCQREVLMARQLAETAEPFLAEPGKHDPKDLDAILARVAIHLENQPATPYRAAVLQVQRRVEAGRRGEAAVPGPAEESPVRPAVAALGQPAPDFVAANLATREPVRLQRLLGGPVLLFFYSPRSRTAEDLLHFAQEVSDSFSPSVKVLGLAVTDDPAAALRQRQELGVRVPLCAGGGLRLTYNVDATPKLIVLDGNGVIRGSYVGWGRETPTDVTAELKHWLRPGGQTKE